MHQEKSRMLKWFNVRVLDFVCVGYDEHIGDEKVRLRNESINR